MATRMKFPERRRKRQEQAAERQIEFNTLPETAKQARRPRDAEGRKVKK